jgi:hypothetical protein
LGVETKTVYVEPGEHKITIIFERRPAILPCLGRTMCSASVSASAGERAVFTCGIRPEVARLWVNARRAGALRRTVFVLAVDLAAVPGWLFAPYLRQAAVFAVIQLAVNDALIPLCYRLTSPVFCAFLFVLLAADSPTIGPFPGERNRRVTLISVWLSLLH